MAILGVGFIFHFSSQLYAPISFICGMAGSSFQQPAFYKVFQPYLHTLKLYHRWAYFENVGYKASWLTVQTAGREEPTARGLLNDPRYKRSNYFEARLRRSLYRTSSGLLVQFVGKDTCRKLNLSDSVQVSHFFSYFNLNFNPVRIETVKTTSRVACQGLITWPG